MFKIPVFKLSYFSMINGILLRVVIVAKNITQILSKTVVSTVLANLNVGSKKKSDEMQNYSYRR